MMNNIRRIALKHALQNALHHKGNAQYKAVLGKVIAELGGSKDLRQRIGEIAAITKEAVDAVNSMDVESIEKKLAEIAPEFLKKPKKAAQKPQGLPELPNVGESVVMRFAPGPSGPLHIGHSRAAVLNDEYVKRYGGKFILRIEDTNPRKIAPEAYDMIPEDLAWLGVDVHETHIQSDRFSLYYKYARKLLQTGNAYVCLCSAEKWRALKARGRPCTHRSNSVEANLELWEKMLSGAFGEGEATYVVKTDIQHTNPALRDFVGFRIITAPHPRTGEKYIVYPLYNFSVAIDDALMHMTHVLRGKDHLNNTYRQQYIFDYLGWKRPQYIHYGLVSIKEVVLKTTTIADGIRKSLYSGWDDVRLGTLKALAKRGISPAAIRKFWVSVGIKEVDITLSWDNLYAINRSMIDASTPRLFFVAEPVMFRLEGIAAGAQVLDLPLHPQNKGMGTRTLQLSAANGGFYFYLAKRDVEKLQENQIFRLKDFCNVKLTGKNTVRFVSKSVSEAPKGAPIIQWVPAAFALPMAVHMPDGKICKGLIEKNVENYRDRIIQCERFGFVRVDKPANGEWVGYFAHN